MITTKMYFFGDGLLTETTEFIEGASHLIVTILDGIPISSVIVAPK